MKSTWASKLFKDPPSWWDWLIFGVAAAGCFLIFEHTDIVSTGAASLVFLQGHILDFYDEVLAVFTANAGYLPSTYIVFALWNIPIRLLGLTAEAALAATPFAVVMWYKLLPTAFYMACALVMYQLALQVGLGPTRSRLAAYLWITTPIAFFSQFIFGQYDSLGIFLLLLGILFYFRGNLPAFALLCGAAFTFKYFHVLIFMPLLLLREKRIGAILRYSALFAVPAVVLMIPFLPSPAFREGVFTYSVPGFIWMPSIWNGYVSLRLVVVGWMLACAWAYFVEPADQRQLVNWALFFANTAMFLMFGLALFHPQWLLLATPFWVLSSFMSRKPHVFLILDVALMLVFVAFTASFHGVGADLFALGALRSLAVPVMANTLPMQVLFLSPDPSLMFSACSGLMLVHAVFTHPKFCAERPARTALPGSALIRARFMGGIAIFVIPVFVSLFFGLARRPPFFSSVEGDAARLQQVGTVEPVQQVFVARRTLLTRADFMPCIADGATAADFTVGLQDAATGRILFSEVIDGSGLRTGELHIVRLPFVRVQPGGTYAFTFTPTETQHRHPMPLCRSGIIRADLTEHAVVDGVAQPFALAVRLFGY